MVQNIFRVFETKTEISFRDSDLKVEISFEYSLDNIDMVVVHY